MHLAATVQEGTVSDDHRKQLAERLPEVVQRNLNTATILEGVVWTEIPSTYGYTAGKPSRCSIVMIEVPDTIAQSSREALMQSVCDVWMDVSGCTINEIAVSAVNAVPARTTT